MTIESSIFARLSRGLDVRSAERRTLGLLAAVFGLGEAGRGLGMNASDALFFVRFGVEQLPWMYIGLGGLTFLAVVLYAAGLARYRWRFLHVLYLSIALLLVVQRFLIPFDHPAIYPTLWLSVQVFAWVLVTAAWNLASQSFDTRQAKRLFALLASASILGSVIGNAMTGWLANAIGTENLFLVYALLLLGAFLAVRRLTHVLASRTRAGRAVTKPLTDVLTGFRSLKTSRLLRLIVAASIVFSVLFFSVWFPFNKVVSDSFGDEAALAGFLGNFTSIVMGSTLLLSLVSSRIYSRLGVVNVILLVPLIYLAGFGMWIVQFSLATAILFRFTQLVWINGAGWTAWNALFNVYHSDQREQLRAFESGVPAQIGTSLSGVLLLLGERVLTTDQIFLLGGTAASLLAVVCWRMRPAYGRALLDAIRAGLVDVFTGSSVGLGRFASDAQARVSLVDSLDGPNPSVRRIAAVLLGRMGARDSTHALIEALSDESADVRQAAVRALRTLGAGDSADAIRPLLSDSAAEVRVEVVRSLAEMGEPGEEWAVKAGRDEAPIVRAEAAVQLHSRGSRRQANAMIVELLKSGEVDKARAALEAAIGCGIVLPQEELSGLLRSQSTELRQLAVAALGDHSSADVQELILQHMQDPDKRVRSAAASSARRARLSAGALFKLLERGQASAQLAALAALELGSESDRQALIGWTSEQTRQLETTRNFMVRLAAETSDTGDADLHFLFDLLKRRREEKSQVILQALRKLASEEAMRVVERGLGSRHRELHTKALEALETLGEPGIVRSFVPLLEEEPELRDVVSLEQVLRDLGDDPDPWLRAFSTRVRAKRLWDQIEDLRESIEKDGSPIVKEVWSDGLEFEGARMSRTLGTLSTMERILCLRQIPILDDLGADDLHEIAEIAVERSIPEGGYLCREGELEDELYLIVEGTVMVTKLHEGRQKEIRRLGSGQPVGELAVLAEQPRSATVRAVDGNVRVLAIRGEEFQAILRDRPAVSAALLANLARRLGSMV